MYIVYICICVHCVHVCILYICMCVHCVHVYMCLCIHCVCAYIVCMCIYVCTLCACVYMCVHCVHVWTLWACGGQQSTSHIFLIISYFMFLRHHWSWCSSIQLDWVTGKSGGSSLSPHPRSGIIGTHCCAQLFTQVLGIQTKTLRLLQLAFYFQRFSYTPSPIVFGFLFKKLPNNMQK